uniref:Uncharacterized protein n=1 Tax=Rhizophora mucronata TaxID=61149 RepID=A0A2P2LDP3_RHIMU
MFNYSFLILMDIMERLLSRHTGVTLHHLLKRFDCHCCCCSFVFSSSCSSG